MKIRKELIRREIAGDVILVPVGGTVLENNGLFALNELGAFLWDRLESVEDEETLVQAVLAEYEVDEATARTDTAQFLQKLREMEIL
ncbi:MAG: PqqD family protein [Oscillospiraceae bacterium]|nr:PqqD family protein [Oscillospiraceae bacterium]